MKRKYRIIVAVTAAVVIVAAAAATTAFVAARINPPAAAQAANIAVAPVAVPTDADYQAWGCPVYGDNYDAIAKLLGMTPQDIEAQLEQGKSLVEIAAAKGVSEDKLVAAILAPMKDFMQQQVTAGKWTQAQVDSRLQYAQQHVKDLVNAKGGATGYGYGGCGFGGNSQTPNATGSPNSNSGSYRRGGMMGGYNGGYGGMMGGYGGGTGAGYRGMMGGWY